MRRGLVVGKFMPLHRGHQLLIETALANVDDLTVIVYNTDVNHETAKLMPAQKRAGWIRELYPQVQNLVVLDDILTHLTYTEKDDPSYAPHYAEQVSFLGPFTHVFSSEDYGEPFAAALGAEHVTVDAAREMLPISGTKIREELYEYRGWVDPIVYRSLVDKVVFVGTESTGKSTLSRALAEAFKTKNTQEYGRTLWEQKIAQGITPSFNDLLTVATTQYQQEQAAALHSRRYLFCDTNPWTTMLWSEMYYGVADSRIYDLVERTKDEYTWFLCRNDFDWVDDGMRELRGLKSHNFQNANVAALKKWGIDYTTIGGSLEKRMDSVAIQLTGAPISDILFV